jgi:hypothetical protein
LGKEKEKGKRIKGFLRSSLSLPFFFSSDALDAADFAHCAIGAFAAADVFSVLAHGEEVEKRGGRRREKRWPTALVTVISRPLAGSVAWEFKHVRDRLQSSIRYAFQAKSWRKKKGKGGRGVV